MALLLHFPTPQDGADAYQTWLDNGNTGTFSDYLNAITGDPGAQGLSAYQVAVANGYIGTEAQWLNSLKVTGPAGKSAYQSAVDNGYIGTETQWAQQMTGIKTNLVSISPADSAVTLLSASWMRIGAMYTVYISMSIAGTGAGFFTINIPGVIIPPIQFPVVKADGTNIRMSNGNTPSNTINYASTVSTGTYHFCFSFLV